MPKDYIPFRKTKFFSSLICDYLEENNALDQFYNRYPSIENFHDQIVEKRKNYPLQNREILASAIERQYGDIQFSDLTKQNIRFLRDDKTFTITTGHQLNLFTGPLYFLYKIISTINLTKELSKKYPEFKFIPMYWMASEDHDFKEINYFSFRDLKLCWNRETQGAVGRLSTNGLDEVLMVFSQTLGNSPNANYLKQLFQEAYLNHNNLTDATRYLANELFKDYGLVIIDADDKKLKQLFVPYLRREIQETIVFNEVTKTNEKLSALSNDYPIQVNPREINLFYLADGIRERIIEKGGTYTVKNTNISWDESELLKEIQNNPERFSPNVLMRPVYQEVLLPNLCYIGGGGELAYWLQLKTTFKAYKVTFPVLLLRNSVLIQSIKQNLKLKKLEIENKDLFLDKNSFINKKVRSISNIDIDFSPQMKTLNKQFEGLYNLASKTDKSFLGAVSAQERKQIKGLEKLEKRLLKAQKKKLADHVSRLTDLQNELFPNQNLQERVANFSEFYLIYGDQLIPNLIKYLQPIEGEFLVLSL